MTELKFLGANADKQGMSIGHITIPRTRPISLAASFGRAARRPLVVFDMAFQDSDDNRMAGAVSGAALWLSSSLKQSGIAIPFFLPVPLIQSEFKTPVFPRMLKAEERTLIFALSLYDNLFLETQQEVRLIRESFPAAKIIMGGPSVNSCRDLKDLASFFPEANALVRGDGELIIVPLVEALSSPGGIDRKAVRKLKGIYFIDGGFEHHDERPNVSTSQTLNDQPWLVHAYPSLIKDIRKIGKLLLNTSRSCKYRCIFCSGNDGEPIYWIADRIEEELRRIKGMIEKGILPAEARTIEFTDNDFFQDREKAIAFLRKIAEDPALNEFFEFCFQASVASFYHKGKLDVELLDLMKRVLTRPVIGTDGFHGKTLRALRKPYTWKMAKKVMLALSDRKIPQGHDLILTYPGITRKVAIESLRNLLYALQNFSVFWLLGFNLFMVANESNDLMGQQLEHGQIVYSPTGVKKRLPYNVPLFDRKLEVEIEAGLEAKFSPKQTYLERLAGSSADRMKRFNTTIEEGRKSLGGENTTNRDILTQTSLPLLHMLAIMDLIERLEQ